MNSNHKRWFYISLLISLLLHVSTFVSLDFLPRPTPPDNKEIEVTILEAPLKDLNAQAMPQQIVDQPEKSINDETPKDAKYLSRNNQRVEKETRAEANGKFANRDNGTPQPQKSAQPKQAKSNNDDQIKDSLEKGPGKKTKLKDLIPKYSWSTENSAPKDGEGPSTSDDYLKNKARGAETLLNTREFVYYSYYSRIKERLRMYWEPKIKGKISRILSQGRKLASDQDHVTKVIITLDSKGTLVRVQVVSESGVRDLDDAAVEAFQAAAPFPNPPAGIVDSDGTIKIRWDFVLEARVPSDKFFHKMAQELFGSLRNNDERLAALYPEEE